MRNLAARCTLGGKWHGQGPNRQLLGPLQARSVFAVGSCRDRTDSQNVIYRGLSTPLPECQCSLQRYSGESGNRDNVRCVKGVGWKKRGKLKKKKKKNQKHDWQSVCSYIRFGKVHVPASRRRGGAVNDQFTLPEETTLCACTGGALWCGWVCVCICRDCRLRPLLCQCTSISHLPEY